MYLVENTACRRTNAHSHSVLHRGTIDRLECLCYFFQMFRDTQTKESQADGHGR